MVSALHAQYRESQERKKKEFLRVGTGMDSDSSITTKAAHWLLLTSKGLWCPPCLVFCVVRKGKGKGEGQVLKVLTSRWSLEKDTPEENAGEVDACMLMSSSQRLQGTRGLDIRGHTKVTRPLAIHCRMCSCECDFQVLLQAFCFLWDRVSLIICPWIWHTSCWFGSFLPLCSVGAH